MVDVRARTDAAHAAPQLDVRALGKTIQRERLTRELSLEDLAQRSGVSRSMLSAVERESLSEVGSPVGGGVWRWRWNVAQHCLNEAVPILDCEGFVEAPLETDRGHRLKCSAHTLVQHVRGVRGAREIASRRDVIGVHVSVDDPLDVHPQLRSLLKIGARIADWIDDGCGLLAAAAKQV